MVLEVRWRWAGASSVGFDVGRCSPTFPFYFSSVVQASRRRRQAKSVR